MTYRFKREDTGEILEVDFDTAMSAIGNAIKLPDGVYAIRVHDAKPDTVSVGPTLAVDAPMVSDTLGFGQHCLAEMEADRRAGKFDDVQFRRDPKVPEFYQVHCDNRAAFLRYMKHRGYYEKNSLNGSGAMLSQEHLDAMSASMREKYGDVE